MSKGAGGRGPWDGLGSGWWRVCGCAVASRCVEGIGHGDGCRRLLGVCAFGGRNVCGVCV